jgi:hypothetical protein
LASTIDKQLSLLYTYKQLTCQSLSIALIQLDGSPMSLVNNIPAEIRVGACLNTDIDQYTSITIDTLFEEVCSRACLLVLSLSSLARSLALSCTCA